MAASHPPSHGDALPAAVVGGGGGGHGSGGAPRLLAHAAAGSPAADPTGEAPLDPVEHLLMRAGPAAPRPGPLAVNPFEVVHWVDGRSVYALALSIPGARAEATQYVFDWGDGTREEGPGFMQHLYGAEGDRFLLTVTRFTADGPTHTTTRWLDLPDSLEPTAGELILTFGEPSEAPRGERAEPPAQGPTPQGNHAASPEVVYEVPGPPALLLLVAVTIALAAGRLARARHG